MYYDLLSYVLKLSQMFAIMLMKSINLFKVHLIWLPVNIIRASVSKYASRRDLRKRE